MASDTSNRNGIDLGSASHQAITPKDNAPLSVSTKTFDPSAKPDLRDVQSVILVEGPRVRKIAKMTTIRDRHTGKRHHQALTLQTIKKLKAGEKLDDTHSFSLSDENEDEIEKLQAFIAASHSKAGGSESQNYYVLKVPHHRMPSPQELQYLFNMLTEKGRAEALARLLEFAAEDKSLISTLVERAQQDPQLFADAAAAVNLARYSNAVDSLKQRVNSKEKVSESVFQSLLTQHSWMFGSEDSELLSRRRWTRDEQQDFVLRRTTDGYIELVEIKTTLNGSDLFLHDQSHDS